MFDIYILIDIHILIAFICFTEGFIFLAQIFEEKNWNGTETSMLLYSDKN